MPVVKVTQSAANAEEGSALYEALRVINQIQAAVVELDADATGGGVVTTMPDTIQFKETGAPV